MTDAAITYDCNEGLAVNSLGKRLEEARRAAGYTQKDLARLINCSHQTISRYESGEIHISAMRLHSITRCLEITLDKFFEEVA